MQRLKMPLPLRMINVMYLYYLALDRTRDFDTSINHGRADPVINYILLSLDQTFRLN